MPEESPPQLDADRGAGTPRARWPWVLGVGMILVGITLIIWPSPEPHESIDATDSPERTKKPTPGARALRPIHVSTDLRKVPALPAKPGALAGCNVLLVTLDTTRADRIGCYGNPRIQTPNLDRLASEGVVFSQVIAVAPTTLPTHASIHTGLYPARHGARTNGLFRLDESHQTLAETLRAQGYQTGAVISAFVLDSQFGVAQGFEHYDDDLSDCDAPVRDRYRERQAESTTDRAAKWLRGVRSDSFFLWVHYFDPHADYQPPGPYAERYARNLYDGEIAYVDGALGRLIAVLDELELAEQTLVVVVGDHGESLGQHGELTHGYLLSEATLRVPLIMRCGTRLGGGVHVRGRVSQVDIVPTVLSLVGLQIPDELDGIDLTIPLAAERPVFVETLQGLMAFGWAPLVGVYQGNVKFVEAPKPELYSVAADPFEQANIYETHPELAANLRAKLSRLYGADLRELEETRANLKPSAGDLERLAALGYIGATGEIPDVPSRPNPKDMMPALDRAEFAAHPNRPVAEAIAELKAVTKDYPDFFPAWKYLGDVYRREGELELASEALARCVELRPDTPETVHTLALVKANQGKSSETIALLEPLVSRYPDHLAARYLLAATLVKLGRFAEAAPHLRHVFEVDPEQTFRNLGDAAPLIARSYEQTGSQDPSAMLVLSAIYAQQSRFQKGIAAAERARSLARQTGNHELVAAADRLLARMRAARNDGAQPPAAP